ncbi:MAG TPA: NUDIX domain-containing protein [Candidatus Ruania gallistercoris]|uniref:NUDIX domain-containing protein n=1 Tax=Candidatus Ruania gallistercoris TaxID=2838746 RepID=A0A9D2EHC6_9MICO|nr:NUDIX domain-containing protein [Candidatus Ruania gallistercoris]
MPNATSTTVLTIAGVCFVRPTVEGGNEALLTVRKRGTSRFMLPGGKLDPGETAEQAAVREVAEEIGVQLTSADLHLLGHYDEEAANETNTRVAATVYTAVLPTPPKVAREIDELRWQPLAASPPDLAPLLARRVLPALRERAERRSADVPPAERVR